MSEPLEMKSKWNPDEPRKPKEMWENLPSQGESCLLSCRVGYLIAPFIYIFIYSICPTGKKGLRLKKKSDTLSRSLSVWQTLFRMAFSCIWLCGSLIKIKLFISSTPARGYYSIRYRENKSRPSTRLRSARVCLFNWVFFFFFFEVCGIFALSSLCHSH